MRDGIARSRLAVAAGVSLAVVGAAGAAFAAGSSERSSGPDFRYGDPNPFASASAAVHVVHTGSDGTHVTLHIKGVDAPAGQRFGAHVHVNPCGALGGDAGGHYQHSGATGSLEEREVWLDFTVNRAGNGHAEAVRPWPLDEATPRSVILHALPTDAGTGAAGARLACIDLDGE
jgi:Cu-Zn family superoxide dismutase